ncbi:MAG TPA: NAD(P) transhydrogenase subunit alpha [Thermoplasmata archaeon]|nr:NAD(P) transhydrogenase subunit alpha [Thermoplasmata archaeon]
MAVRLSVLIEETEGERRVALVPEVVRGLVARGLEVAVEAGAGERAGYPDPEYRAAGATIGSRPLDLSGTSILLAVQPPTVSAVRRLPAEAMVVSLLFPARHPDLVRAMQAARVRAFALELLPRITRAQSMDVLSSQATVAGYRSVIAGAEHSPRLLPMLTTAAGTIRPAKVLVLGAGVAGLMAIATAKRLGAVVEGYDVRRAAGEQVRSLGARFLELEINAEGAGGYARELTVEEKAKEQAMVGDAVASADVVITTANVPGRKAPQLISRATVERMRPGSVIVDLAAESGGNCELTSPGKTTVEHGVTLVGSTNLPSEAAFHASQMFAKNLQAFLGLLVGKDGRPVGDFTDEILSASLVVRDSEIVHAPTKALLGAGP